MSEASLAGRGFSGGRRVAPWACALALGCGAPVNMAPPAPVGVAVLGGGRHASSSVTVVALSTPENELAGPRDLAFDSDGSGRLWVMNHDSNSATIFANVGFGQDATARWAGTYSGLGSEHFLSRPSCLAFGPPGFMATAHEEDEVTQTTTPADFMGPTLWDSTPGVFEGGLASHLDMLHNSPNAIGIAWERDNAYWIVDGAHGSLTRYDFHAPHVHGGDDHSDGTLQRYVEGQIGYVEGVSSHAEFDHEAGLLYVADAGNNRVVALDVTGARRMNYITPNYDGSLQERMRGGQLHVVVDGAAAGLRRPSGLALHEGRIFVTDNETSRVYAFEMDGRTVDWLDLSAEVAPGGLMGLAFGRDGGMYLTDAVGNRVLAVHAAP